MGFPRQEYWNGLPFSSPGHLPHLGIEPGVGRSPGSWALFLGFPCGSAGEESTCNAGDLGSIPGLGRFPWRREWQPTPVFWPGKFMSGEFMSGLETPVHGVAKSQTQLSNIHFTSQQPM